ncbi:MAG: class I SAM-dependent methyltransferase [Anaerolineae bacterium]|nr:class I SAM-dependent methyltransferase [Anaerolineae bacterium]MDW8299426.1 class I SAM-dependent methyltransferase [Anaerolineae bacterium]
MALPLEKQNRYRAQYRKRRPSWQPATEVYEGLIRAMLRPYSAVLDVGCGRGGVLEQLGEAVALPFGVDPDLASLREHRLPALPRAAAYADALPFRAASFDLIVCSWLLEHLQTPERTFREFMRVLKPDGRVIFITPNANSLVAVLSRLLRPLQRFLVPRLYGRAEADTFPLYYRANTPRRLMRLAERVGGSLEQLQRIPDPTYLAFTPFLFRLSCALAEITPPVHLVGMIRKG